MDDAKLTEPTILCAPLSDERLLETLNNARNHAEQVVARYRAAQDSGDPASEVWRDLTAVHGGVYLVVRALVKDRGL